MEELNLFGKVSENLENSGLQNFTLEIVRVQDVILDSSHVLYSKLGEGKSIGAIQYSPFDQPFNQEDTSVLPTAYMLHSNVRHYPVKNELVILVKGIGADLYSTPGETTSDSSVDYYLSIIGLWNDTNHNASPPSPTAALEFGNVKFSSLDEVKGKNPFPGDIIIEGRQGQSIRFTGTEFVTNPYTDSKNEGKPLTIISNGHQPSTTDESFITEDVNETPSSIWMTSNHRIPLEQIRTKYASYRKQPIFSDKYTGAQTLLNTDRLFFNARQSDILFSAQESFGVTSKSINLDGEDYIGLDAKKIYLGEVALISESQPVLLGNEVERILETLITEIKDLAKVLQTAKTVDQKAIPSVNLRGKLTAAVMDTLLEEINPYGVSPLKSTKVFTE